jgi:hypothetical protein
MVPPEGMGVVGLNVRMMGTETFPEIRSGDEILNKREVGQLMHAVDLVLEVHCPKGQVIQVDIPLWSVYAFFGHERQELPLATKGL